MSKLVLKDLTKRYGDFAAVDGISIEMSEGEFVSLLGPSGCGKTTTLRMIAGFIDPTAGEIQVSGSVVSTPGGSLPPERRGMSMIFQSYAIWPNMTVFENVAFGLKMRRCGGDEIRQRVGEILEVVQLGQLAKRYPNELSGGQQQRVALARAIVVKPQVLLLDEPLSNLDANLREEMRGEIRRLHDEFRITTVYVTHDQSEAMAISDRIAVMNRGRIEQIADPFTIYTRPRTRFVAEFIGRTNLIGGRRDGGTLAFEGFDVPIDRLEVPPGPTAEVTASLRPQNIAMHRAAPQAGSEVVVPAVVVERCFLGESWEYVVAVNGAGTRLRVSAPATNVFSVHDTAWLQIAPAHVVPIQS